MKKILLLTWCLLLSSTVVCAEMHFPQLPQHPSGWDVASVSGLLADDWLCMETGPVTEIHFWGGYQSDVVVPVTFTVSIHDDDVSSSQHKPGALRWSGVFSPGQYTETECPLLEGSYGFYVSLNWGGSPDNHIKTYQYDMEVPEGAFEPEQGTLYWLVIGVDAPSQNAWGWRTSPDCFENCALYTYVSSYNGPWQVFWYAAYDWSTGEAYDLAFNIGPLGNNLPPVACAGDDQTVEQQGYEGSKVTLDGSCSTDPDSIVEKNDDIVSFDWYEGDAFLGSGQVMTYVFSPGIHNIRLEVTDTAGETDDDDMVVTVQDTTPPDVSISVTEDSLWPPNHKMVDVGFSLDLADIGDAAPEVSIEITSDEPTATAPDAGGKKHAPDAEITEDGTLLLRAERSGESDGRVYNIAVTATDVSGNSASCSASVKVNHDKKTEAVDSGQDYDARDIN